MRVLTNPRLPSLTRGSAIEPALLVALTALVAYAFSRSLHAGGAYDEGVYMASLDALEHGQRLGSQVFASQPPGFYLLLEAARHLSGSSIVGVRSGMLALSLVGCLSAYYIGRSLGGMQGGLLALAMVAI